MEEYLRTNDTAQEEFENLTLADNFMFGEVMYDEQTSKDALEIILGVEIGKVMLLEKEKAADNMPGRKSIRLDVYVKDDANTVYNIEMQVEIKHDLPHRSRYYQGILDTKCLPAGARDYRILNPTYIIFICQFDPFGENRCCYTFEERCVEDLNLAAKNGCKKIFLNTKGTNREEIPVALLEFLDYIRDPQHTTLQDSRIKAIDDRVKTIKHNAEVRDRYMTFTEWFNDEVDRRVRKREEVLCEREEVLCEREEVLREQEEVLCEREEVLCEREEVLREQEEVLCEREEVLREQEEVLREQEEVLCEREEVLCEREEVLREQEKVLSEREQKIGQWVQCITYIRKKKQQIPKEQLISLLEEFCEEKEEVLLDLYQMTVDYPEETERELANRCMERYAVKKE